MMIPEKKARTNQPRINRTTKLNITRREKNERTNERTQII